MRLTVVSHKVAWASADSPSGYATDGGFPMQMRALSELFDETVVVVPCAPGGRRDGEQPLEGHNLRVVPLELPHPRLLRRRVTMPAWLARNLPVIVRELRASDAVHTPIPGDIGSYGMLAALLLRKPLFVRHCGNWTQPRTVAEKGWRWMLERFASPQTVVLATGGADSPPSERNAHMRWIFSTSLTAAELQACRVERVRRPDEPPRLVIAARQERAKGTGVIIDALPAIARRHPEVRLDVLGDGGALDEFRSQASALGVERHVCFHGRVNHEQVMAVLREADVFCFPTSASEGFPKAVLEAMASGLPVVTTSVSVLGSLVGGTGAGTVISAPDAGELARAVMACLEDSQSYATMSRRAVEAAASYSLESWRETIGAMLTEGWGPLRSHA